MIKISNNIRLTQKRNLLAYLQQFSLKIDELFFVEDLIYGEDSYVLATKIVNNIPSEPSDIFYEENKCKLLYENFIKNSELNNEYYYIVLKFLNRCHENYGLVVRPDKPILKVSSKNLLHTYNLLLRGYDCDELLICSESFKSGIFVDVYADHPTEENNWYDGNLYECYEWSSVNS